MNQLIKLMMLIYSVVFLVLCINAANKMETDEENCSVQQKIILAAEDINEFVDIFEDPLEEQHTKAAVIATIGTDQETEAFGYDFDYVCRVVMAESGSDSDELQTAVATCIFNAYLKEGLLMSPEQICHEYGYTAPALAASDRVIQNTLDVLYLGNVNERVEDALYFYQSRKCNSDWHERQTFITEIDGVRFFK